MAFVADDFLWIVYIIKKGTEYIFFSTISFYMLSKIFYPFTKMSRYKIQVRFSWMICISPVFDMLNNVLIVLDVTSRFMTGVVCIYLFHIIQYHCTLSHQKIKTFWSNSRLCISFSGNLPVSGNSVCICLYLQNG